MTAKEIRIQEEKESKVLDNYQKKWNCCKTSKQMHEVKQEFYLENKQDFTDKKLDRMWESITKAKRRELLTKMNYNGDVFLKVLVK